MSTERRTVGMLVYHGTNSDIDEIILTKGNRFKDFGQGFYVTPNIETANRMAKKKASLFGGTPIVITYIFDETVMLSNELKVLVFPEIATAAWIYFIDDNRNRKQKLRPHGFDLIKGPIADDGVALQLGKLRAHADSAESIAVDLQDVYLDQQICFSTQRSLKYLKKQSVCQLR